MQQVFKSLPAGTWKSSTGKPHFWPGKETITTKSYHDRVESFENFSLDEIIFQNKEVDFHL